MKIVFSRLAYLKVLYGSEEASFAFLCCCRGKVARLRIVSGIGSVNEFDVCIFGKGVCRWAQTKLINDHGALVSCGMHELLCHVADCVSNSRVYST